MTAPRAAQTRRSFRGTLASIAESFIGARECAAAVENGRMPSRRALDAMGIDAETWSRIGRL
ncbi:MAG: hypothetical protein H7Y08_05545 [Rhizobiaceae bacterium]|nr:hypothetical protein [Rhizobiaceae bacterium]